MSSTPDISPDLFLDCNGEPMRFYIRPGPAKAQLHKVITAGGGCLCRVQEPGAILLVDPKTTLTDSSGQLYVSTQYILDCVKHKQQLDEMNYRLSTTQQIQTRSLRSKEGAVGRMGYSAEEDEAILTYMSKHQTEARGNSVWQLMEKQKVTCHTWQSMKDRYLKHLRNRQQAKAKLGKLEFVSTPQAQKDPPDSPGRSRENEPEHEPVSGDDAAVVPEAAGGESGEERPEEPMEVAEDGDGDGMAAPPGQEAFGECPEGDMVAVPEEEHAESSPKRSRLDADERSGIGGSKGSGNEDSHEVGGLQASETSTPTKRRLGILDRAVREFRNSFLNEESQPQVTASDPAQSDSDTEMFYEALEPEDTGVAPQQRKRMESQCNGDMTAVTGESTQTAPAKFSSCSSHLFLLESESQEEDLGPASQEAAGAPQSGSAGERLVLGLMKECGKDLLEVTKALLKTSGDVRLAQRHFLQGTLPSPLWSQKEDQLLLSADPISKCQLQKRYGKERVSARVSFLQAE